MVFLDLSHTWTALNRARTVMDNFQRAAQAHGLPSPIRCDLGVENVDIAYFMLIIRGTGRGSMLVVLQLLINALNACGGMFTW